MNKSKTMLLEAVHVILTLALKKFLLTSGTLLLAWLHTDLSLEDKDVNILTSLLFKFVVTFFKLVLTLWTYFTPYFVSITDFEQVNADF